MSSKICASAAPALAFIAAIVISNPAMAVSKNPATPNLAAWNGANVRAYNCFNYAQASKVNGFEQIAGYAVVFDQTKPAYTAAGLKTAIMNNYASFTDLGAPADPPATPDDKSLVALVVNETKGYIDKTYFRYALDLTGRPIRKPGGGFRMVRFPDIQLKADFHWYRLNGNAAEAHKWSDKPGKTPAKEFKNAGVLVTNPKTADRGGYTTFASYYSISPGAAGSPSFDDPASSTEFDRPGMGAQTTAIFHSGHPDTPSDIGDIDELMIRLPTGDPIPDPNWEPFYLTDPINHFGGYDVTPDAGLAPSIEAFYIRAYLGAVAMYRDRDGLDIQYYADNNDLAGFLAAASVPEPASLWLLAVAGGVSLLARRSRKV